MLFLGRVAKEKNIDELLENFQALKEIRYKNPNQIYGIVYSAILKAINSYSVSSHTNFSQYNNSNYQNIAESIQTDYSPNFQPQE